MELRKNSNYWVVWHLHHATAKLVPIFGCICSQGIFLQPLYRYDCTTEFTSEMVQSLTVTVLT